jgi:hypothetical protein
MKRALASAACVALAAAGLAGYRTIDSQTAWAALWSFCAPSR